MPVSRGRLNSARSRGRQVMFVRKGVLIRGEMCDARNHQPSVAMPTVIHPLHQDLLTGSHPSTKATKERSLIEKGENLHKYNNDKSRHE